MNFSAKKWKSFAALIPVTAISFLDQTILPVALPTIQRDLDAGNTALQWSVDAYLLAITLFVLVGGKLGDRIGHRKALIWGVAGFAIFSALCGLSNDIGMLIGGRALQGVCAALAFPAQTALIGQIFPPQERGRATGIGVSIGSLFLILGPLIGGYLTEVASWRWLFWINLPISAIALWMIFAYVPTSERGKGKVDLLGFTYFAIGVSCLTICLMQLTDWGWTSMKSIGLGLLTLVSLLLLFRREKTAAHPFLDLTLFKHPVFSAININVAIIQFILMITVSRSIYFQEILDYSPIQTGLITFISSAPVFFLSPIAGYLSDKFSPKLPIAIGYVCLIYSFLWLGFFSTPGLASLITALLAFGIGIPLIFTPSYSTVYASVPPHKTGVGMGMIFTLRMLGGTVGLALIHAFISAVEKSQLPVVGARLSEVAGFSRVHFALAFLLIVAFACTFVMHNRKSSHHLPDSPAEGWD